MDTVSMAGLPSLRGATSTHTGRCAPTMTWISPSGGASSARCRCLLGYPGLRPLTQSRHPMATPLLAYRLHTDYALAAHVAMEAEGHAATSSLGHAAVRFTNPSTGRDVLPTRCRSAIASGP